MAVLKITSSGKKDTVYKQFTALRADKNEGDYTDLSDYLDPGKVLILYHDGDGRLPTIGDTIYEKNEDDKFIKVRNRIIKIYREGDLTSSVMIITDNDGKVVKEI